MSLNIHSLRPSCLMEPHNLPTGCVKFLRQYEHQHAYLVSLNPCACTTIPRTKTVYTLNPYCPPNIPLWWPGSGTVPTTNTAGPNVHMWSQLLGYGTPIRQRICRGPGSWLGYAYSIRWGDDCSGQCVPEDSLRMEDPSRAQIYWSTDYRKALGGQPWDIWLGLFKWGGVLHVGMCRTGPIPKLEANGD